MVTATAGILSDSNFVEVSGATLTLNGPNTLAQGGTTTLSILLQDSGGNGIPNECIVITSEPANTLSSPTEANDCTQAGSANDFKLKTDFNGQATLNVTVSQGGQHIVTARALERTDSIGTKMTEGTFTLTVSSATFVFIAPAPGQEVNLGDIETVTIRWQDDQGVGSNGQNRPLLYHSRRGVRR